VTSEATAALVTLPGCKQQGEAAAGVNGKRQKPPVKTSSVEGSLGKGVKDTESTVAEIPSDPTHGLQVRNETHH